MYMMLLPMVFSELQQDRTWKGVFLIVHGPGTSMYIDFVSEAILVVAPSYCTVNATAGLTEVRNLVPCWHYKRVPCCKLLSDNYGFQVISCNLTQVSDRVLRRQETDVRLHGYFGTVTA